MYNHTFISFFKMARDRITHIVWDGDNTLWDWIGYAVPAYEAMCQTLSNLTGKSYDETARAMKEFYSGKGTIEDEGLVQGLNESGFFSGVEDFDESKAIRELCGVYGMFTKSRTSQLKKYPAIKKILEATYNMGKSHTLLTDAPINQARARLRHFGLAKFFEGIYGMPMAEIPRFPEFLTRQEPAPEGSVQTVEKPHTDLEKILRMTREQIAKHVAIIGDNASKDMALAERYGCLGIHASYGASSPEAIARIQVFAPERVVRRNMQMEAPTKSKSNIVTVNHPSEIWDYVCR